MLEIKKIKFDYIILILIILLIIIVGSSFFIGRFTVSIKTLIDIIRYNISNFLGDNIIGNLFHVNKYWEDNIDTVIFEVRFPRILMAIMAGGALSLSGASYQTLFKNPMVSPDVLGISAGAGFGAALAMVMSSSWLEIQIFAFIFGIIAVSSTYFLSKLSQGKNLTTLILSGIIVSSFFQALLSILKTIADPDDALPSITFWLMGSLGKVNNKDIRLVLPIIIISCIILFSYRYQINALSASEEEALSMGVDVKKTKFLVVLASTLLTVTTVSVCGTIGWVGMVVPHISRLLVGSSYNKLAPVSFLLGGSFLLIIDNIVRGVPGVELPLGVLTALIGTPIFAILLIKSSKEWR